MEVLGLFDEMIIDPYSYCKIKKCFLTKDNYDFKQCKLKNCDSVQIINTNDNLLEFITKPYSQDDEFDYYYTDKPMLQMELRYERNKRKKNMSSVPELKKKLKQITKNSYDEDLNFYYKMKYQ